VKIKNPWYLTIHRALDSKSIKRIIELVEGGEWRAFWEALPKSLQKDFDDLYGTIRTAIWDVENRANDAWKRVSEAKMVKVGRNGRHGRKDFAQFVNVNVEEELRPIMFSILDGREWRHHTFAIIKRKLK
jgi:DNA-binding ferritin-like protein (Dps family)